nr:alpha/beta fold hydrolase [uncultured Ralstonia sp.]
MDSMDEGLDSHAAALSKLIGLIYDTAGDQALWPQLLESMADYVAALEAETVLPFDPRDAERMVANWFDGSGQLAPLQGTTAQKGIFLHLAPHFVRAFELQRQFAESDEHRRLLEAALDQLPLGIAVIRASGALVSINSTLLMMLREHGCLAISAGRLTSRPQKALADALQQVVAEPGGDVPLRLDDANGGLCIWVSRLMGDEQTAEEARLAVWVASSNARSLAESGLRKMFGTTPAETRLIQQLITGRALDEAAQNLSISINTAKTQLKSVFEKVGVKRQSELVHAIYATPLWLKVEGTAPSSAHLHEPAIPGDPIGIRTRDSQLTLPDGRRLAWSDTGDPDGLPVILMHAIAGSRHLRHPDDRILYEQGVRLIVPERPGIGDSDPLPGRRVRDWPKDVAALADHLGLQRFVVLGYSGAGTPYALATAQCLPDRVRALFLVGAAPPIEHFKDLKMFSDQSRMPMLVARYSPNLLPPAIAGRGSKHQKKRLSVYGAGDAASARIRSTRVRRPRDARKLRARLVGKRETWRAVSRLRSLVGRAWMECGQLGTFDASRVLSWGRRFARRTGRRPETCRANSWRSLARHPGRWALSDLFALAGHSASDQPSVRRILVKERLALVNRDLGVGHNTRVYSVAGRR